MSFRITLGNRKLGSIYAINLPAIKTCRKDTPCAKLCYATKGNFLYPCVKNLYEENMRAFLEDSTQAENDINSQLPKEGFVRVHASGDFMNRDYFDMIVRIAKQNKKVRFMAFTKQYEIINSYLDEGNKLPANLKILFSGWYGLEMDNPHNLPTAYVELRKEEDIRIKKSAMPCSGACYQCFACWNVKKGQQVLFTQH